MESRLVNDLPSPREAGDELTEGEPSEALA
jgi:hypothetical protein